MLFKYNRKCHEYYMCVCVDVWRQRLTKYNVVEKHYDDDCSDALISPLTKGIFFFISSLSYIAHFISSLLLSRYLPQPKKKKITSDSCMKSNQFRFATHLISS